MPATRVSSTPVSIQTHASTLFRLAVICFMFSGATALIYEVLWARMLGLVFGATTIAISAVLAAFMGGLALGSALAAKIVGRQANPIRTYAVIEIAIGFYALVVPWLFTVTDRVYAAIYQIFHPGFYSFAAIKFVLAAIVLLIPTSLMGATLPVLVAIVRPGDTRSAVATRLYTWNLAGAVIGTIAAGFFLLPSLGVTTTIRVAAAINLIIGIVAFVYSRRIPRTTEAILGNTSPIANEREDSDRSEGRRFWFLCAFASGAVTIGMQIVWSRLLALIIGSSTYAFTIVLALFLFGLAIGARIVNARAPRDSSSLRRTVVIVQLFTALALFLSLRFTSAAPSLLISAGFRFGIDTWAGLMALQILTAAALMLVPIILMGMAMPLVLSWTGSNYRGRDGQAAKLVGQSYALNTLGAIFGSVMTAFILIPMTSTRFTVYCAASLGIVVASLAYQPRTKRIDYAFSRSLAVGAGFALVVAMLFVWPRVNLNALSAGAYDSFVRVLAKSRSGAPANEQDDRPGDHQLLMYQEGRTATVSVRRDWGIVSMAINGRTNGSDADDMPTQVLLGHLGLLAAKRTERVLIIGFATGVTAGSVLQAPVKTLESVEIEPAAITSSRYFEHVNNRPLSDPRLRLIVDDARTYLRVNPEIYDVIVSEPSHPWVPGTANLFTREFFTLGRNRLGEDGLFVQWIQIYQLSTESLRSALATFNQVFPHVAMFRIEGAAKGKDLLLLGSLSRIALDRLEERMKDARVAADLNRVGLKSAEDLRAWFVCDETRLRPAVAGATINTDDNMHIETVVPREAFRPTMEENARWVEQLKLKP